MLFVTNDILLIPTPLARKIRHGIAEATNIPEANILVSATHTHSAPRIGEALFPDPDGVVPPIEKAFVDRFVATAIATGIEAVRRAVPAALGFGRADVPGIGG